jgi:hypothetical protein
MKAFVSLVCLCTLFSACGGHHSPTGPSPVRGCTDKTATNYNPSATQDDGSCIAPAPPGQPYEPVGDNAPRHYFLDDQGNNYKFNPWVRLIYVSVPPGSKVNVLISGFPPIGACNQNMCFTYKLEFGLDPTPNSHVGMTLSTYWSMDGVNPFFNGSDTSPESLGSGSVLNGQVGLLDSGAGGGGDYFRTGSQWILVKAHRGQNDLSEPILTNFNPVGLFLGYHQ